MNLLPIPWIKEKLEKIYNVNLYGKLYLMFNDIVNDYNIDINKLIISFKYLYHDNIYIVLCGYKDNYPNLNELDCLANLCSKYENLDSIVNYACLIDSNKIYKIINALLNTQQIYINPLSSCS